MSASDIDHKSLYRLYLTGDQSDEPVNYALVDGRLVPVVEEVMA